MHEASRSYEALNPKWRDSPGALDRQGDIIEIVMGACRHDLAPLRTCATDEGVPLRLYFEKDVLKWKIAYEESRRK